MRTVGTFEAKTHLSALLGQVAWGEELTLERIVARLKGFRKARRLGDLSPGADRGGRQ